jgi:hypothetical protein
LGLTHLSASSSTSTSVPFHLARLASATRMI